MVPGRAHPASSRRQGGALPETVASGVKLPGVGKEAGLEPASAATMRRSTLRSRLASHGGDIAHLNYSLLLRIKMGIGKGAESRTP